MISLELWRAKIGLFNCSRPPTSSLFRNLYQRQQQSGAHGWFLAGGGSAGLFSSLCRSLLIRRALVLLLVAVISHLLLSAGDVEQNPGPLTAGSPLTVKNLLEACREVTDWKMLGIQLNLKNYQLEETEAEYRKITDRKIKMFTCWINNDFNVSWAHLITALRNIGDRKIAGDIEAAIRPVQPSDSSSTQPTTNQSTTDARPTSPRSSNRCKSIVILICSSTVIAVLVGIIAIVLAFLGSSHDSQHATPPTQPSTSSIITILQAATPPTQPSTSSIITILQAATPPTQRSSGSIVQQVTSEKALLDEFPVSHITEPLTLCSCLNNDDLYINCKQIVSDHHMQAKTATMKILGMWINKSPKLTWKDVVETLSCYGLVNKAVQLAERHGVE